MPLLPPDPPARPPTRVENLLVGAIAVGAGVGAAFAGGEATGWAPADIAWPVAFAVLAVLAGAKARRWTWLVATGVAAAAAPSLAVAAPALVGLAIAVANVAVGRRTRVVGAVAAGLAVQTLLRLELDEPFGTASLVALAALAPLLFTGFRRSRTRTRRIVVGAVATLLVLGVGLAALQAWAVVDARASVASGIDAARAGFEAARAGEEADAVEQFDAATADFEAANDALTTPWGLAGRAVPVLGQHARAMQEVTDAGATLSATAAQAAGDAPIEELQFVDGALDLAQVAEFGPPLAEAEAGLVAAETTVAEVDSGWLVPPLADRVDEFAAEVDEALPQAEIASEGVAVAPSLFGGEGLRRYFVAFVTPAEQRGMGGFMGNFGVLNADDGDLTLVRSDEIIALQDPLVARGGTVTAPADYVARYGRFQPGIRPGDVTLSPDFPSVSTVIGEIFPQSGGQALDGVILVDPIALEALLTFTGPITVTGYPTPLTSENAAEILLREQYVNFDDRADRKDFLEEASRLTFQALTSGDLPGPRRVSEVLGPMVDQGRLLMHSFDPEEQAFFEQIGLDGAFPDAGDGDLVAVTTQNSGHNKGDSFLTRSLDYRAEVDPDTGVVEATATVTLENAAPAGGLPDVLIGVTPTEGTAGLPDLPPGTNRMYLSLYTPHAVASAEVDGVTLPLESQQELGVNVYAQYVTVPPGATVTVTFRLAGGVDLSEGYRLTVAGQATINPDQVSVSVGAAEPWALVPERGFEADGDGVSAGWTDSEDHVLTATLDEG